VRDGAGTGLVKLVASPGSEEILSDGEKIIQDTRETKLGLLDATKDVIDKIVVSTYYLIRTILFVNKEVMNVIEVKAQQLVRAWRDAETHMAHGTSVPSGESASRLFTRKEETFRILEGIQADLSRVVEKFAEHNATFAEQHGLKISA